MVRTTSEGQVHGEYVRSKRRSKPLALAALLGTMIFLSKVVLPTPVDKLAIVFQAILLGLGALAARPFGATLASTVGGLLTAFWRAPFAPFTLGFAVLYGVLIDGTVALLRVRSPQGVDTMRLVAAVTVSTAIVGLMSYYAMSHALKVIPRLPLEMELAILAGGVVSGLTGGYLAGLLWTKALRHIKGFTR